MNTNATLSINCPTTDAVPDSPDPNVISGVSTASTPAAPAVYSPNVIALDIALTKV